MEQFLDVIRITMIQVNGNGDRLTLEFYKLVVITMTASIYNNVKTTVFGLASFIVRILS